MTGATCSVAFVIHPNQCRCNSGLDYSEVADGKIDCRDCGRRYRLISFAKRNGEVGHAWKADPKPPRIYR